MANEMRDRLVGLLKKADKSASDKLITDYEDAIQDNADYLIENGVIVPPCKVGDTVYIPWRCNGASGIAYFEVTHIIFDRHKSYVVTDFETDDEGFWELYNGGKFEFADFGKIVFCSIEEAHKKLKGGADNGKVY